MSDYSDETLIALHDFYKTSNKTSNSTEQIPYLVDLKDVLTETTKPLSLFYNEYFPLWFNTGHSVPDLKKRELTLPVASAQIWGVYYRTIAKGLPVKLVAECYKLSKANHDSSLKLSLILAQGEGGHNQLNVLELRDLEEAFLNGYEIAGGLNEGQHIVIYTQFDQKELGCQIKSISSFGLSFWCLGYALGVGVPQEQIAHWVCTGVLGKKNKVQTIAKLENKVRGVEALRNKNRDLHMMVPKDSMGQLNENDQNLGWIHPVNTVDACSDLMKLPYHKLLALFDEHRVEVILEYALSVFLEVTPHLDRCLKTSCEKALVFEKSCFNQIRDLLSLVLYKSDKPFVYIDTLKHKLKAIKLCSRGEKIMEGLGEVVEESALINSGLPNTLRINISPQDQEKFMISEIKALPESRFSKLNEELFNGKIEIVSRSIPDLYGSSVKFSAVEQIIFTILNHQKLDNDRFWVIQLNLPESFLLTHLNLGKTLQNLQCFIVKTCSSFIRENVTMEGQGILSPFDGSSNLKVVNNVEEFNDSGVQFKCFILEMENFDSISQDNDFYTVLSFFPLVVLMKENNIQKTLFKLFEKKTKYNVDEFMWELKEMCKGECKDLSNLHLIWDDYQLEMGSIGEPL